jgi:hypothetical protein
MSVRVLVTDLDGRVIRRWVVDANKAQVIVKDNNTIVISTNASEFEETE